MIAPPKPPSRGDLEALIKEARERQLRRRLLGSGGVAIAAAIGLCAYAVAIGGHSSRTNRPVPSARTVARCQASQLSASSYWNGAAGTLINVFSIANRGSSTCSLPPERPLALLRWHGSLLKVSERASSLEALVPGKPLHILAPGRRAAVYMQWWNWCGRPQNGLIATVALRFHDGLRVTAQRVSGEPPCMDRTQPSLLSISGPKTLH
jgi:hypothetical protein